MHIKDILSSKKIAMSFEFFPPKTEKGSLSLFNNIKDLIPLGPAYVSVTYGAGGSTRDLTNDLVIKLHKETNLTIISHLTCVGSTQDEIKNILQRYSDNGIENIMALRGDPPQGSEKFVAPENGFKHAADLVKFIKKNFPHMGIGVAGFPEGHPECPNRLKEMEYLKAKVDEGADYICTQLFFDNRDFYDFKERCAVANIKIPIIAGIMPVTSINGIKRMAELALGARFPAKLLKSISRVETDEQVAKVGIHWATQQALDLIDNGVEGIHLYTLNKSKCTQEIYHSLGITHSENLEKDPNFI